jgi:membrane protease subunit HflK
MAAFKDVASAREEKNTKINEAEGYSNKIIPEARGEAVRLINEAEAYKARIVREATGESQRFLTVLAAYSEAKDITRKRMYLEAMEEILSSPGMEKIIMPEDIARGVLPLLPLTGGQGLGGGNP